MLISRSVIGIHFLDDSGSIVETIPVTPNHETLKESLLQKISLDQNHVTDNRLIYELLKNQVKIGINLEEDRLKAFRLNKEERLAEMNLLTRPYEELLYDVAVIESSQNVKSSISGLDTLITQAIFAIDDLTKTQNLLFSRLTELYNIHFPELVTLVNNQSSYAKLIMNYTNRDSLTKDLLTQPPYKFPQSTAEQILSKANSSLGAELKASDQQLVAQFASLFLETVDARQSEEKWVEETMKSYAPNLSAVAGANIGARLMAKVGGLRDLAMKTSSKIQTLGAEKALYKAIRSRGNKTPKHGIIFQIPEIGTMPFWLRGRMARSFAAKIAIAARLDFFDGESLGPSYRDQLRQEAEALRKEFPNPPKRKPSFDRPQSKKKRKGGSNKKKGKNWKKKGGRR